VDECDLRAVDLAELCLERCLVKDEAGILGSIPDRVGDEDDSFTDGVIEVEGIKKIASEQKMENWDDLGKDECPGTDNKGRIRLPICPWQL
jgi:hypothetical protein